MQKQFILFDFDGVIADSFVPAFEVVKMICPHIDEDGYRKRFEGNINDWDETNPEHTKACRHDIDFFAEYIPKMKERVTVVPGMTEVIYDLAQKYSLIIVSSTITSPIREFMEKYSISHHFVEIMGNDVHFSKVEKMKMIFDKHEIKPDECVFITDTLGDMREAKQANVGVIGVSWGFHKMNTLRSGGPFRIVENPTDLPSAVSDYFATTEP